MLWCVEWMNGWMDERDEFEMFDVFDINTAGRCVSKYSCRSCR